MIHLGLFGLGILSHVEIIMAGMFGRMSSQEAHVPWNTKAKPEGASTSY